MRNPRMRWAVAPALVAVLFVAAACGGDGDGDADGDTPVAPAGPFGAACSQVPADGAGSFEGMMTQPVVTAASENPLLTSLVADLELAGLTDTLNTADGLTVFAPTNDAFAAAADADPEAMEAMMADPTGEFADVLAYHVVEGQIAPADLAGEHETLEGSSLSVEGGGEEFTVDGSAMVVCGDIHTDNATVYVIDAVLHP
ncbi:MAG TPA: fasciclin domain-containing protein [Actinomycetota bacterium]